MLRKSSEVHLYIPHTMELVETVESLELMHTNRFPYPCGDRATVFRGVCIIKPLEKLIKLRDHGSELVGRNCIEKLAKCPEHKFPINCRSAQILRFPFSLSPGML